MIGKRKILIFIDWFLPGIKAGGPIKSVAALVNQFHDEFNFYIITRNTDFGTIEPFENITSNSWIDFKPGVKINYLSKNNISTTELKNQIKEINPDVIYLNSFFSFLFSILPLIVAKQINYKGKIILAPRGMLSEGALRIKPFKKKVFILVSKLIHLHKNIIWHSTKSDETNDIKKIFGNVNIKEIQNIPNIELKKEIVPIPKIENELNLIYLGRIVENKNLKQILEALTQIKSGKIQLDIFGFIEDENYWNDCKKIISQLPEQLNVKYKGILNEDEVKNTITNYHYLIMLSYSENFGHAIIEALYSGVPVIIGENTPWKELEKNNAGWNVNVSENTSVIDTIYKALRIDTLALELQKKSAIKYAYNFCFNISAIENYIKMLN